MQASVGIQPESLSGTSFAWRQSRSRMRPSINFLLCSSHKRLATQIYVNTDYFSFSPCASRLPPGLHGHVMRHFVTARRILATHIHSSLRCPPYITTQRSPVPLSAKFFLPYFRHLLAFWLRPWECGISPACTSPPVPGTSSVISRIAAHTRSLPSFIMT
jgi:hypothetical protein